MFNAGESKDRMKEKEYIQISLAISGWEKALTLSNWVIKPFMDHPTLTTSLIRHLKERKREKEKT